MMSPPFDLLLSTAYAPPVSYFAKLFAYESKRIGIEAHEHYIKQSYRNRCRILSPNGVQSLTVPVSHPASLKVGIRDVRISSHGSWRHLHLQALRTAYGASPFFQYYQDELASFYQKPYTFLWDLNIELLYWLIAQLGLSTYPEPTQDFLPLPSSPMLEDLRYVIRPRRGGEVLGFSPLPYYQLQSQRFGFVPDLSIFDLLFEMGPEALLILRDSLTTDFPNP